VLDAVGDHYFYKDVFGAFMWGSEPAENAADTRQVKQARLDLKSPWNAFLVLATIISVVGIIFSIIMFWRSFKQRREDKTLEFSEIAADYQDNTITVAKAATMFKGAAAVDASIVQMLDCIVEKDQTREMTDSQYNLLNELRKGLQEMKNELLMLYMKIALGILEDLPLASLGIAWVFMSESSLTEIQTLSFAQSMLMLGLKLCEVKNLPARWAEQTTLRKKAEAFSLDTAEKKVGTDEEEASQVQDEATSGTDENAAIGTEGELVQGEEKTAAELEDSVSVASV